MKNSEFRSWVERIWRENCQEHFDWNQSQYTMEEYFGKFKYWLKREYRHQMQGK